MPTEAPVHTPYCGAPPIPGELIGSWNLDPVLIGVLLGALMIYAIGLRAAQDAGRHTPARWRMACFYAGWLITSLALVSPLCNLTVALFSARVGQHMILTLVAAPLIMLGRPGLAAPPWPWRGLRANGAFAALRRLGQSAAFAWLLFAAMLWLWHAPGPYDATLANDAVYWSMHLTLFGSALLLWRSLLLPGAAARLCGVISGLTTSIHMGLLGAILTVAPRPLYAAHVSTTWPWGLTQLEDQQLGGIIMWVPGCSIFLTAGLLTMMAWLHGMEEHSPTAATAAQGR